MEIIFSSTIIALSIMFAGANISRSIQSVASELADLNRRLSNLTITRQGTINVKLANGKEFDVIPESDGKG